MHARVVRINGSPDRIDEGIANFRTQAVPALKQQEGYAGSRLFVNRGAGSGMVITFWRDEQTLRASEEAMRGLRSDGTARFGAEMQTPENYEAAVQHRPRPTEQGNWVRITTVSGDPAKVDEGIRHFESQVIPSFDRMRGFRAAVLLVDRATGAAVAGTVWDSQRDLDDSAREATPIRATATKVMGATSPQVENFEVEFAELLAPVGS